MLLFCVHLRSQQKRTKSYQIHSVAISIFRVAIISNVQNVHLQHRHRPTDDTFTCQWRGSQQTGTVRTTWRTKKAQLVDVLDFAVVHMLHALFCTFFSGFGSAKIIKIR